MFSATLPHSSNWHWHISYIHNDPVDIMPATLLDPKALSVPSRLPKEDTLTHNFSAHNHAPSLSGRAATFSIFSEEGVQKGGVLFNQWIFKVRSSLRNYYRTTSWESINYFLCGAAADLVCCLGPNDPVSHTFDKLELMYGTVASCDIIM